MNVPARRDDRDLEMHTERLDAFEQRLEDREADVREIKSVMLRMAEDVSYMRGRLDQMFATPPAPPPRKARMKPIAVNLGLGTAFVAAFEAAKHLLGK